METPAIIFIATACSGAVSAGLALAGVMWRDRNNANVLKAQREEDRLERADRAAENRLAYTHALKQQTEEVVEKITTGPLAVALATPPPQVTILVEGSDAKR